jgi:8-oxo-dGTP pyrophosphatase MutT (NUDIX family)
VRKSRRTTYENPWLRFEAHDMVHPNGQPGEHGVVVTPRASSAIVLDGDDVILARQSRFAIDRIMVELVKGGAGKDESPEAAAQRELREELGIVAARWDYLGLIYEIPSIVQEPVHIFLARDISAVESEQEDVESVDPVRMPFREAYLQAARGEINDAVTVVALMRVAQKLADEQRAP